ncbi:glycoside hydrolase family 47 protein [Polyplosphaeria fusca]|uniref:alpha-1,2-Mannosidase n=1 Tax=Polyplosphaeria fusca TaxID=682080 RepID=A0A9P4QMU9_9PLEO|nr:glycoside hydrolase family 47 protein [Polyplosphaeria fusca]
MCRIVEAALFVGILLFLWQRPILEYTTSEIAEDPGLIKDPKERARIVRGAFVRGWNGYMEHAYPHDTLKPLSNTAYDDRNGWGATAVDALTAAILLDVPDAVETALNHIVDIDWKHASYSGATVFGSTIRYMSAMLSAHDLLTTTHRHLLGSDATHKLDALLKQSQALADVLAPSFQTAVGINSNFLNLTSGKITETGSNDITAISGLVLEWTRLTDLSGVAKYSELAMKSMQPLLSPKPESASPFPGLLPKHIDLNTGLFDANAAGGWSHTGGGFYEMLLKLSIYNPSFFAPLRDQWIQAADSTMTHLASHPKGHPELTFLADFQGSDRLYQQDASSMFAAASFLLGGIVTGEPRFRKFGLQLVDTCVKMYAASATGLGPERFAWVPDTCDTGEEKREEACSIPEEYAAQLDRIVHAGFWVTDAGYRLRPEVLESLYYAYRVTGDEKYRDASWRIVGNVIKWCETGSGFAELEDVGAEMKVGGAGGRKDWMSSYVLSETLMYAYIIHLEDEPWQVQSKGSMDWVWSTQGHPLRTKASM